MTQPLKVRAPQDFAGVVRRVGGARTEVSGFDGQWLEVSGGPLPTTVLVRVDRQPDGRHTITGLAMGQHQRDEITWETLRQIKPASLLEWIFAGYDPDNPAGDGAGDRRAALNVLFQAHVAEMPLGADPELVTFASAYLRNLAAKAHRAMTATADELHISRATAIRRAARCREVGLLPAKDKT